ncbi:MAG TPA: hypothetical protein PLW32_04895 [Chitinophagaceae bacterium]|jgi:hypothetical protein|nr:hypothetical protein [Chitinophagaceae bacterium]MBP9740771.1 hypothetical protein [Chitinophagaceae bacterium]HPH23198.1 hypothetical protein [Chitinophagaceae bacterium]
MSNKNFWIKKAVGFTVCAATIAALLGYIVMLLWNNVLAEVTTVKLINFWQALGLLLLSKILFGGFNKGFGKKAGPWSSEMKAKWHNMNAEEKEQFKQQWRNKCSSFKRKTDETFSATNQ